MPALKDDRICIGAFAGAHGVKGDAIIKTFTETPENIAAYGQVHTEDGARTFTFWFVRLGKPGFAIVSAPEITSREDAESLKGTRLYINRETLPDLGDDEFYLDDLVGLTAVDEAGAPAGRVSAVYNFGAGDIIELEEIPGIPGSRMVAFTKATVPAVDLAGGRITIARAVLEDAATPVINDETGEIVSDDVEANLSAVREEDK